MQSPGLQPIWCVSWCLIWWYASFKKFCHIWHRMSLLRPGVIKKHLSVEQEVTRWKGSVFQCKNCVASILLCTMRFKVSGHLPFSQAEVNDSWDCSLFRKNLRYHLVTMKAFKFAFAFVYWIVLWGSLDTPLYSLQLPSCYEPVFLHCCLDCPSCLAYLFE